MVCIVHEVHDLVSARLYTFTVMFFHKTRNPCLERNNHWKRIDLLKRKYIEESSDESDSDHQLSQTGKTNNDLPLDSDESLESTPMKSKTSAALQTFFPPVKSKPISVASRLSTLKAKAAALSDEPQISPEKVSHKPSNNIL